MFWTPEVPQWLQTLVFYEGFENTPVATKAFGTPVHSVSRSGAQNTTYSWPQSGRDLGLVVGPPGPPQRAPGEAQEPPRERETLRTVWILEKLLKASFLEMGTPLECQAHFGQKGPQTERQS